MSAPKTMRNSKRFERRRTSLNIYRNGLSLAWNIFSSSCLYNEIVCDIKNGLEMKNSVYLLTEFEILLHILERVAIKYAVFLSLQLLRFSCEKHTRMHIRDIVSRQLFVISSLLFIFLHFGKYTRSAQECQRSKNTKRTFKKKKRWIL